MNPRPDTDEDLQSCLDSLHGDDLLRKKELILSALNHQTTFVRSAAVEALRRSNVLQPALLLKLNSEADDLVLSDVCDAVAALGMSEAVPALREIATVHESSLARSSAVAAVVTLLGDDARSFLQDRAAHETDGRVRVEIDRGLVLHGHPEAIEGLIRTLEHEDDHARCAAASVLPEVATSVNREVISAALHAALKSELTVATRAAIEDALVDLDA
jgi:HEAT repeat protein